MQLFFKNGTHILPGTQGKHFEDMFLIKIANKGTSLKGNSGRKKKLSSNEGV